MDESLYTFMPNKKDRSDKKAVADADELIELLDRLSAAKTNLEELKNQQEGSQGASKPEIKKNIAETKTIIADTTKRSADLKNQLTTKVVYLKKEADNIRKSALDLAQDGRESADTYWKFVEYSQVQSTLNQLDLAIEAANQALKTKEQTGDGGNE